MKRVITVESVTLFMSVFNVYENIYCRIGFNNIYLLPLGNL